MKSIKIAYLEYSDIFSGAEGSMYSLIKHLNRNDFTPIIIFRYPLPHQERYADLDCRFHYLANEKKWWMGSDRWEKPMRGSDMLKSFLFALKIAIFTKKEKIDILHINLLRPNTFWCVWLPKLFGIKVVGHSRSDTMHWIPSKNLQTILDGVICVSEFVREKVLLKNPQNTSAFTIYNPIDYNQYEGKYTKHEALASLGFSADQFLLSSVGLLSPHKGHDMAIRVFARIATDYPKHLLMIAGGGNESELSRLKTLCRELEITNKVHFTEQQISEVARVYKASDIVFSLTTRGEAFGRVPFEANACSTAVIAPAKGAAQELIVDGETGFLADPLDEEVIVRKTLEILKNPLRTKEIIQNGINRFKPLLSPEYSAQCVANFYLKILRNGIIQ